MDGISCFYSDEEGFPAIHDVDNSLSHHLQFHLRKILEKETIPSGG